MSSQLVLVTGASGFLGTHIVTRLLEDDYRVRAVARKNRVDLLKNLFSMYGDRFQIVIIDDISTAQFPEALQGVDAVIHSASPQIGQVSGDDMIKTDVDGTLNVVRQVEKAGIKRLVMTASIATAMSGTMEFTADDWADTSNVEDALKNDLSAYVVAKTIAEKEVWKFADSHPNFDVTTLNPPMFYGPVLTNPEKPDWAALTTNVNMYNILTPNGPFPFLHPYIDVRDVARLHVAALHSPLSSVPGVGHKRMIVGSPTDYDLKGVLDIIATNRPELKDRLTKVPVPEQPWRKVPFYADRVSLVFGMKDTDFIPLEKTVLDTVDALIALEKKWIAAGYEVVPPAH